MERFRELLIETLRGILKSETANDRLLLVDHTIKTLKYIQEADELVKKFEELRQKITLYAGDILRLANEIKAMFPDLYSEVISDPDLASLILLSKTSIKYYAGGKIIVRIHFGENRFHEFEFKRDKIHRYIMSRTSDPDKIKWLVDPLTIKSTLEALNISVESLERITKTYNDYLVDLIHTSYQRPLPFKDEEEEEAFELFKLSLADYEHIYEWKDRERVIDLLPIDPRNVIFTDDKYVYIPTKWFSHIISARRLRRILTKLLKTNIRAFDTSYMKDREKIRVYYFVIPKKDLVSKLGVPLTPKKIDEVIKEEKESTEDILKELENIEKEENERSS